MKFLFSFLLIFLIFCKPSIVQSEEVILAGGCFWCLEHDLESLKGVEFVQSGYSGGDLINPTYDNHETHQEVVLVDYNEELVDLDKILRLYLRNIDPLDGDGQFCDRGDSYRPVIFFKNQTEESKSNNALINASRELKIPLKKLKVELKPTSKFWLAENYHQDFAVNNELRYKFYRYACGRDKRLEKVWKDNARTSNDWSQ